MASWFGKDKGREPNRPRTPEEREAAYQERLRRRTGEIPEVPQEIAFSRLDLEAGQEAEQPEPESPAPAPEELEPESPVAPPPEEPEQESPAPPPVEPPEPEVDPLPADEPSGVRRAGDAPVLTASSDLSEIAALGGGRPAVIARPPRRPRWCRRAALVVPAILLGMMVWALLKTFQPLHGNGGETIRVTIPQGATVSDIGELLEKRGVIASPGFFEARAWLSGQRGDIKAGSFFLRKDMSNGAAIAALTGDPITPKLLRVVIPEGLSIREARPIVRDAGVRGPYRAAAIPRNRRAILDRVDAPAKLRTLEGLLFPATYELPVTGSSRQLVRKQTGAFEQNFSPTQAQVRRSCRGARMTTYEVVIVASMVEREASLAKERPVIASVICNRLQTGMPLGIDATIRYKVRNWSRPLTQSQLAIDSAYNTRTHKGLPPTPIGSPGLSSLEAALKPAKTKYLYYVVKPCGEGAHNFSASDAEFQEDVDAYNRKRDELGRDPSSC